MTCRKHCLFKFFAIAILFSISTSNLIAAEREDLYREGKDAYSNQKYVEALKKLYAFYVLNEIEIDKNPELKRILQEKISASEAILKLSFAVNSNIEKRDKVVRIITKERGGIFTGTGMEVDELLNKKAIDLEKIQDLNHKTLPMPSNGYSN